MARIASKLDSAGVLRISAQEYRSQLRNKKEAFERLAEILRTGLQRPKRRKATKPTRSSVERRLESKKKHSQTKSRRRSLDD